MRTLVMLIQKYRVPFVELAGVVLVVVALSMLAGWAGWLAGGVALLVKAFEWDLADRPPRRGDRGSGS